jgi:transposase
MIMERISKQQLQKMYGVNRFTIENWVKTKGLPLITITSHSKYITIEELRKWEEKLTKEISLTE